MKEPAFSIYIYYSIILNYSILDKHTITIIKINIYISIVCKFCFGSICSKCSYSNYSTY